VKEENMSDAETIEVSAEWLDDIEARLDTLVDRLGAIVEKLEKKAPDA
jgi:hypothetical protein